jgi:1-phosphatidylinositol-3-phosphate 5-kinase
MVACFRYASIDVHSVYLPPHKLIFDYGNEDWIKKESDEVQYLMSWILNFGCMKVNLISGCLQMVNRAELLFSEVLNGLSQIGEKRSGVTQSSSGHKTPELRRQVADLEGMLQREKLEFEVRSSVIIHEFIASFIQVPCLVVALYKYND